MIMLDDYKKIQKDRMAEILNAVLSSNQITRNILAEELHLSPSSIAKYIKTLKELGLVRETGSEDSTGGRKSAILEFDPEIAVNIAVVFNLSYIEGALINPAGTVIERRTAEVYQGIPAEELISKLLSLIEDLKQAAIKVNKKIFGVGLGMGDHLDMEKGVSHNYHLSRDWLEIDLKNIIEKSAELPFFLINDLDAGALGEKYYGYGTGVDNFACVWLDETIGMGLILNNQLYYGKNGYVGEIGHTRAVEDGPLCNCGNRGCLETVATEGYILKQWMAGINEGVHSEALRLCGGKPENIRIEDMIEASNSGDRFCRNIFEETAEYIGRSLTDVANILNPELITLRGSIIDGNTHLYESISRRIKNQALEPISRDISIKHSRVREDIRLPGVSSYILSRYFYQ